MFFFSEGNPTNIRKKGKERKLIKNLRQRDLVHSQE